MRGKILRTGVSNYATIFQSRTAMLRWPPIRGRNWISWIIFHSLLASCSEMSFLGSCWWTWYFMVREQTCSCSHKMDKILWQTFSAFDLVHSSHMWIQAILSCGELLNFIDVVNNDTIMHAVHTVLIKCRFSFIHIECAHSVHGSRNKINGIYSYASTNKNTRCNGSAVDKEWEKLENIPSWQLAKVRNKNEVIAGAKHGGKTVHFASLKDLCHLKNLELEPHFQKYKGRVVLRGDIVKDDSGSYAVFTEEGSSASQLTAAKVIDVKSSLPRCAGQAADAISAYTQVKMEDAPSLFKIPKSECPDIWIRLPKFKWPKSWWSSREDPVVPLQRNLYGHHLAGLLWERQFEKILLKHGWEKIPTWECLYSLHREKGLFLSVYVDDIKLAGKKQNIDPMWKILMKDVDLGKPTSFLDHAHLGCTQRVCQKSKDIVDNYRNMFETKISAGVLRNLAQTFLHGPMIWKVMRRNAWNDIANWRTKQLDNYTKSQHHALMTTNSRKQKMGSVGDLSKVCSQIVLKCFSMARIGRPDIFWSVNKVARVITKWTRACDKRSACLMSYIFIIQVNTKSIVMWETQHNNADWDCFRTLILPDI